MVGRTVRGLGMAFEFSSMTPHDRELLHRLLMRITKPEALTPSRGDPILQC
jgi:hypothetical protein